MTVLLIFYRILNSSMTHYSTRLIVELLRNIEVRLVTLQQASDRNTEEIAGMRHSMERLEESAAAHEHQDDDIPLLPLAEDIDHPAPGKDLSNQHFLDAFVEIVGSDLAKQQLKFAKSVSAAVVQRAKVKFIGIDTCRWSEMPSEQQTWMIANMESGCREGQAHIERAKKKWIAKGLLRHVWSSIGMVI